MGEPYTHSIEVREVALSQVGTLNDRHLILVDASRDLFIVSVVRRSVAKLGSMVDSAVWHTTTPVLAAIADEKLVRPQRPRPNQLPRVTHFPRGSSCGAAFSRCALLTTYLELLPPVCCQCVQGGFSQG